MEKQSIIRAIYFMKRGNCERVPLSDEYWACVDEYAKIDAEFRDKICKLPELTELYNHATDAFLAMESESADCHYEEGFKLGVLMGLEIAGTR